ncbi:MAG TPA: hypothetical protein VNY05_28395 [Candidatus Acidoferrales bacterium]|jgi:hypothetical protein|nr:hypothetical protein [Candidatus Acidoferrales bacterium]
MGCGNAAALPLLVDALYDTNDAVRLFTEYELADYYDRAELVAALRAAVLREGRTKRRPISEIPDAPLNDTYRFHDRTSS